MIVAAYEKQTGNKARVLSGSPEQWMAQIEANRAHPPIDMIFNQIEIRNPGRRLPKPPVRLRVNPQDEVFVRMRGNLHYL